MRTRLARRLATVATAGLALVAPGCQSRASEVTALPPGPHVVEVQMTEYSFRYPPAVPAGRVLFRVRNAGREAHSLSLLPLTDDVPPIDQQLRGSRRLGIVPFAGVGTRRPGDRTTFAADLAPGLRYAIVCFLVGDDGQPHALRGMASEFRTGEARGESAPGEANG